MEPAEVVLVDLSSIAYPIWHMSQSEPDQNHTSTATVAKVRAIASGQPHVAVCCDSGRSFRADIDPSYKANRGERDATLMHQIDVARERLAADGFPVWAQPGMEADDLIATAAAHAKARDMSVLVVSADKDLLQLVGPRVRVKSPATGNEYDEAGVEAKLGVKPAQVRDYLTLVGDSSDNVKGADKIGPKTAATLLWTHGSIEGIYEEAAKEPCSLKPSVLSSLKEFEARMQTVRSLITLRTDAQIPFTEVLADRATKEAAAFVAEEEPVMPEETNIDQPEPTPAPAVPSTSLAIRDAEVLAPAPAEWERQLDPRSMKEARALATDMHASRLFSAYGSPQAVLATVLAGRELGFQAMASLRAFHVIDGKSVLSAEAIRALVLRSGKAKFFRCTERTPTRATFETQRGTDPALTLSYTIEEAQTAGSAKAGSGYTKNPADMLVARASAKLARLVYPDVTNGMYAAEEFD